MGLENAADMQSAMQAVEQACTALQVPPERAAAESILLTFRKSSRPFQACQFILEHSQMANARFQAAAALQESALREWGMLTADERSNMRIYCLHYVMARAGAPEAYVQAKVSSVAAVLLKRGWLEMVATEKEAFFNEVRQAVAAGTHGVAGQIAGLSFLESLVSEFSPSTASAMGLSAEFHEHCRSSLELDYLQKFYAWALDAAFRVSDKILQATSSPLEVHVCALALRLMSQILSWEFRGLHFRGVGGVTLAGKSRASSFLAMRDAPSGKRGDTGAFVQPGPTWQDPLLSPSHTNWILHFYACIRERAMDNNWMDSPLCVSARQLILQLCCLNGNIFPSDSGITQEQHLQSLLIGIASWISPPASIISDIKNGKSESELLDGCRALELIASLVSLSALDGFLKPPGSAVNLLSSLTEEVIMASGESHQEEQTWAEEAMESLFDMWTYLLQPTDLSKRVPLPTSAVDAAARVFRMFVHTQLKAAATSADDEEDDSEQLQASLAARDERLSAVALIARAAPMESVSLLTSIFTERCSFLCEYKERGGCPTSVLEELHWILLMSGHVLADPSDGETPMVPDQIVTHFPPTMDAGSHPVVLLSCSVISLAQRVLDTDFRSQILSPRLIEAIVWFCARWSSSYLLSSELGNEVKSATRAGGDLEETGAWETKRYSILVPFSEHGDGRSVLACLVQLAGVTLTSWPGERALLELTCFQLLGALTRQGSVCNHLVEVEGWQNFAKAFAYFEQTLLTLPNTVQRGIAEVLCRSASAFNKADAANTFVRELFAPLAAKLLEISQSKDLSTLAQKPDAILRVMTLIERLRGAARATMPRTQKSLFEIGMAVMDPLLVLLETYQNQSSVVYVLLKYVGDWVEGQVSFLEPKETAAVFNFCVRLLKLYSLHNIGKVSISMSKSLQTESQVEKYKDLRALLQLLTNLSTKDLIDFGSGGNNEVENPDVAEAVYLGLHIIIPLISVDLLKYPKLCRQYFTLLAHMLEVYPEKVAQLSKEGFGQIVSTLNYGLHHQDTEVVNMTLTALNAIAFYHYQAVCKGKEGLGCHTLDTWDSNGVLQENVLAYFLRSLLRFLLFEDYSNELVEPASDALLPLILCNPALYQRLPQDFLEAQHNLILQSRLTAAFHMLITVNQVTSSLDRGNRRRFRENVHIFLAEVRGFLCMR